MNHLLESFDRLRDHSENEPQFDPSKRRFLFTLGALSSAALLGITPEPAPAAVSAGISLEQKINSYIRNLRRQGIIGPDETTAWSVYDFSLARKLVSINEDRPLQSASMIKPFVAQAFFYRLAEKKVDYHSRHQGIMEAMIRRSSNSATNYFIDLVGGRRQSRTNRPQEVERILKSNAPGIFQHTRIVERIPVGGATYRNKASAHDYSRFLYAVWNDRLPYSEEIKRLMGLPNKDRIKTGAVIIPPDTAVYDKTGTTARLCGDMGIVEALGRNGGRYPYTFIAVIEKRRRAGSLRRWSISRGNVIREVSDMVYAELKSIHNLV